MNPADQEKLYAETMGEEALLRQLVEGQQTYRCCGERTTGPHNPGCRRSPVRKAEKILRKHYGDQATERAS